MSKGEERLYELIIFALQGIFSQLGECYLENTSRKFSERLKEHLDDYPLLILRVEKMSPDVTGYVIPKGMGVGESKQIIVAEIKLKPTLKDIYQTKRYAEILNASYALLISPSKLSPERRRFLIKRKGELTQFYPNKHIIIGQFHQQMLKNFIRIGKELYHSLPEPFKELSKITLPLLLGFFH